MTTVYNIANKRKIIHIDMDCFFAAVEMRDNPHLKDLPVAVGGQPGNRSVLCTANYKAREFGVRAALSSDLAVRLCPELIIIRPNSEKYQLASEKVKKILYQYTDTLEPLSIDEAYLDVTDSQRHANSASLIAKEIRQRIEKELELTASAGVAPNKFLAKVASDWQKPDGLTIIKPEQVESFIKNLPAGKIPGVGRVTLEKMKRLGIFTCFDIQQKSIHWMQQYFGKFGPVLLERSFGIDDREVNQVYERKSMSVERTFSQDIYFEQEAQSHIPYLQEELSKRLSRWKEKLQRKNISIPGYPNGIFIKMKTNDFQTHTIETKVEKELLTELWSHNIWSNYITIRLDELVKKGWQRAASPIRLLGIGIRLKTNSKKTPYQLDLFESYDLGRNNKQVFSNQKDQEKCFAISS